MEYEFPQINETVKPQRNARFFVVILGILVVLLGVSLVFSTSTPKNFPVGSVVTIAPGVSTRDASVTLASNNIIRSAELFQLLVSISPRNQVIAGDFQFNERVGLVTVVRMVTRGNFGEAQVKITLPEGSSNREISKIIHQVVPGWDTAIFLEQVSKKEGYLFPETYLVFKSITPEKMRILLENEYEKKVQPLRKEMLRLGKTEREIIIMASLLEKEAKNAQEAKIVSGILWKRIARGMPLQVDAPFLYTLNKTSEQLTLKDLQKDGPYNTYTRKGLPVGPIGNPGLAMIQAAMYPESSPYLYYLHGTDGVIRYGKTYAEHLENKRKFLKY